MCRSGGGALHITGGRNIRIDTFPISLSSSSLLSLSFVVKEAVALSVLSSPSFAFAHSRKSSTCEHLTLVSFTQHPSPPSDLHSFNYNLLFSNPSPDPNQFPRVEMLSSRFLVVCFLYISYATGLVAADPNQPFGGGNQFCQVRSDPP